MSNEVHWKVLVGLLYWDSFFNDKQLFGATHFIIVVEGKGPHGSRPKLNFIYAYKFIINVRQENCFLDNKHLKVFRL